MASIMWNKIYTAVLGISFVLLAVLTYYSYSWLQSPTKPTDVVGNFDYYSNLGWMFLWVSSILLLVLANAVLWTTRSAWAMWTTFLYFALFMLIQTVWLDQSVFSYKQINGIGNQKFAVGAFYGIILCGLAAAIVFFNQFIVKRMRDKMFAQSQPVAANQTEINQNKT